VCLYKDFLEAFHDNAMLTMISFVFIIVYFFSIFLDFSRFLDFSSLIHLKNPTGINNIG
jgi:hypothetical protein